MPLRKNKNAQRPSVSSKKGGGGRSRGNAQSHAQLDAVEMQRRAEAYRQMYRGGGEGPASVQSSQDRQAFAKKRVPIDAQEKAASERVAQEGPAEKQDTIQQEVSSSSRRSSLRDKARRRQRATTSNGSNGNKMFLIIGSLLVIVLIVASVLVWNQWLRYDDVADFQGTWYVEGTDQAIEVTDSEIVLTSDVSYTYTLDTFNKTISFAYKQFEGAGSYTFSAERDTLTINESDASADAGSVPTTLNRKSASQIQAEQAAQEAEATGQNSQLAEGEVSEGSPEEVTAASTDSSGA